MSAGKPATFVWMSNACRYTGVEFTSFTGSAAAATTMVTDDCHHNAHTSLGSLHRRCSVLQKQCIASEAVLNLTTAVLSYQLLVMSVSLTSA